MSDLREKISCNVFFFSLFVLTNVFSYTLIDLNAHQWLSNCFLPANNLVVSHLSISRCKTIHHQVQLNQCSNMRLVQ